MEIERLFIKTLEDIEKKMELNDDYEILMISGLLRKLLLDKHPLIDQVNKVYGLKIRFSVNGRPVPQIWKSLTYYSMEDGFDPDTSVPHLSFPVQMTRSQLLKKQIMVVDGEVISVLDLIKFLSNIAGGVHASNPKKDIEKTLFKAQKFFGIGGYPAGIRILRPISRVVLKGLNPLKEHIQSKL